MDNIKILFEEKCCHVNISQSANYMLLAKNKEAYLYNFKEKKKICDIKSKNIVSSLFSTDEEYIILQKFNTLGIFNLTTKTIEKKLRTGTGTSFFYIEHKHNLYYTYTENNGDVSLKSYNLKTQKTKIIYKNSGMFVENISVKENKLIVIYHKCKKESFGLVIIDLELENSIINEKLVKVKLEGLSGVTYSEYSQCVYFIKQNPSGKNLELYSMTIETLDETKVGNFLKGGLLLGVKSKGKYIYINLQMTVLILNIENGITKKIHTYFPAGMLILCDNSNYFSVYNGEYVCLYMYCNSSETDDSETI